MLLKLSGERSVEFQKCARLFINDFSRFHMLRTKQKLGVSTCGQNSFNDKKVLSID